MTTCVRKSFKILLHRLKVRDTKRVFFTDEKFFLSKPSCQQPEQQSLGGRQESWRQANPSYRWAWEVCAACDGLGWRVLVARDHSTLLTRALKWILRTTLAVSFPVLSTTALDCCPVDTSSSKTARQHTQLVPRRTGSKPTAQISLPKTSGLQIHPTWCPWITMSGGQCWRPITSAIRNRKWSPNWRKSCRCSGTAYLRDQ